MQLVHNNNCFELFVLHVYGRLKTHYFAMGRRPGIPKNQRNGAIGRLAAGESIKQVAQHFNVHYTTIAHPVNRVQHTGTVRNRP